MKSKASMSEGTAAKKSSHSRTTRRHGAPTMYSSLQITLGSAVDMEMYSSSESRRPMMQATVPKARLMYSPS